MPLVVKKDRTEAVLSAVADLVKTKLLVGIPAETADRAAEAGEPQPPNNATIGYAMEFGLPERNIPARPHLLPGVQAVLPQAVSRLRTAGTAAIDGDSGAVTKAYHTVGLLAQNAIRAKITEGPFVPLSPRTLARRRARGRKGEKPLTDTGALRAAYTYVIRGKGR
ncbi:MULTISPECIES: hypothetical protein [Methylobacterium]|uniref:Bacteriophage protein n=2 Tax=Pseudomonadota TaxID=1224 RepID=A0ABQ4T1G7_9HYPH|nr:MULTISPECIES: hypothetical protein [Methylobacterium]PIU06915.1 MAG: hypothetical protein COT56_07220 [Methylobacterium sp. CG09_land_8_20_14_0_10_71_15]PIU16127.1 MAG: hypothetical protein COT28_01540 [Methylobacterium sp. CG08_land_8_20_14_0_20_71_15]GBU18029.1 hypothetical protein AwMethylo_22440 [Methylobacterium sp.]GJE08635.1 hypothetical protein AOPFMNJM_3978 [Methylobacterium jeotgali]